MAIILETSVDRCHLLGEPHEDSTIEYGSGTFWKRCCRQDLQALPILG